MKAAIPVKKPAQAAAPEAPARYYSLDLLADHPDLGQRPLDKEHVGDLQNSIREHGLDVPLIIWDGGEEAPEMTIGGKTVPSSFLVAGLHRRAALRRLKKEDAEAFAKLFPDGVPCVVRTGTLQEMLCLQLRENLDRKNPSTEDILPKVIRLRDEFGMKAKHIAKAVGRSDAFVSNLFDIERELGESGVKEVIEGGIAIKDALKAANELKAKKKGGEEPDEEDVKEVVAKAKAKTTARKESGRERDEKRTSIKKVWERFCALPAMDDAKALKILRAGVGYVVGQRDTLPKELSAEASKKSTTEKE